MNKIIKIEPVEDVFIISWITHLKCNYDCMYCPPQRHQAEPDMHSLEELQSYWQQVFEKTKHQGKKYKISFTGGEVTINRAFLPFVKWLRENYNDHLHTLGITTNGSASKRYYLELFEHINFISFSTHTEHIDDDKFWPTALELSQFSKANSNKSFMVNIMSEYWASEEINRYVTYCTDHNIDHIVNRILYEYQTRNYPIFKNIPNDKSNP